jgi:hypothetical protein
MSQLPDRLPPSLNSRRVARAARAQEKVEQAVFEHHLITVYQREIERHEGETLAEVAKASLEAEVSLLDWGLERAAGSQAKAELVSRKVSLFSDQNSRRIVRNFGA